MANLATYTHFLPQWVKLEPIVTLWAAVSEIRADFKNCHIWAWNLAFGRSFRSSTYTHFRPPPPQGGGEIELIFTVRSAVSEIRDDFQNCHICAWHLAIGSRSYTYTHFPPQEVEIKLVLPLRPAASKIRPIFKIAIFGHHNLVIGQNSRNCAYTSYTSPESQISLHFALQLVISMILAMFHFPIGHNVKFLFKN